MNTSISNRKLTIPSRNRAACFLLCNLLCLASLMFAQTQHSFAAESVHVQLTTSVQTIFSGDVNLSGCSVRDEDKNTHTFSSYLPICVLDTAANTAKFSYEITTVPGQTGLTIDRIGPDKNASDSSSFWQFEINSVSQKNLTDQPVKNGDTILFHFVTPSNATTRHAVVSAVGYVQSQQDKNGAIQGFAGINPLAIMALSAEGVDIATIKKEDMSLLDYCLTHPPADTAQATDWEKAILAITAAGKNPFDFGGYNYEAKLEKFYSNSQLGSPSQINDDVFGLLAFIASGPGVADDIKLNTLKFIIAHQNKDGGFSWSTTGTSDTDNTAAAIQALIAAQKNGLTSTGLPDSIEKAKTFLLSEQKTDGGFVSNSSDATSNTSTTAWAVMALTALGNSGDETIKNAVHFIQNNQQGDGSFSWQPGAKGETFTTSYAILALDQKSWPLHIYTDHPITPSETISITPTPTTTPTSFPTSFSVKPTTVPSGLPSLLPVTPMPTLTIATAAQSGRNTKTLYEKIKLFLFNLDTKIKSFF